VDPLGLSGVTEESQGHVQPWHLQMLRAPAISDQNKNSWQAGRNRHHCTHCKRGDTELVEGRKVEALFPIVVDLEWVEGLVPVVCDI